MRDHHKSHRTLRADVCAQTCLWDRIVEGCEIGAHEDVLRTLAVTGYTLRSEDIILLRRDCRIQRGSTEYISRDTQGFTTPTPLPPVSALPLPRLHTRSVLCNVSSYHRASPSRAINDDRNKQTNEIPNRHLYKQYLWGLNGDTPSEETSHKREVRLRKYTPGPSSRTQASLPYPSARAPWSGTSTSQARE